MEKKKIVIVGGGVAGLTSGIYALKAGFEVVIYEKNHVVGGECTGWDRNGYHIDNCIHWLMGTTEGSDLNTIWKTVGAIGGGIEIIPSDQMYTSELNGESITLWKDVNRTRQELIALSAEDEVEINKLIDYVIAAKGVQIPAKKPSEMMNFIDLIKMSFTMKAALKLFKVFKNTDTTDLMNRFKHPLIRCMISDFCTKESMAQSFPFSYGNFVSGDGGIPRGGSRAMALRMQKRFEEAGGKIQVNVEAKKIILAGERAAGVILSNRETVLADYIICACDPYYTYHTLLDSTYLDPVLKEVYANRKDYPVYGMYQAAFAVDHPDDVIGGELMLDCADIREADWMSSRMTIKTYSYEPGFAPKGKQILQVLLGVTEDSFEYWVELYKNKTAYNRKKEEIAGRILKKLEERLPAYLGRMTLLDSWTPVTYHRYCNAYKGYNQAFMITKKSMQNPYPAAFVKGLENVVISNQWLSPPGGLPGAAIQGKYAIQRILKKEKRKIRL